ncbi:MAG: hypothetical protein C4563_08395 [Desulfobulbus sp.]|nr:MAG: hypothetical protein C4563_08395 [Desulfobulbus sp.]
MPFQQLPDNRGMIYLPECKEKDKKHPCRDCFSCQWCGDERCRACRRENRCARQGNRQERGLATDKK